MRRRDLLQRAGALFASGLLPAKGVDALAETVSTDGVRDVQFSDRKSDTNPELTAELAKLWWPDQRNIWTPIGWKDHYFRFNVLYNGWIVCEPCPHWTSPR